MSETKTCKLLAFQAPIHLSNYLSLYIYHRRFTKSKVLKQALSSWYLEMLKLYPEEELIKQIINDLQQNWSLIPYKNEADRQNKFADFKHLQAMEMRSKGINENQIITILNRIEI